MKHENTYHKIIPECEGSKTLEAWDLFLKETLEKEKSTPLLEGVNYSLILTWGDWTEWNIRFLPWPTDLDNDSSKEYISADHLILWNDNKHIWAGIQ